MLFSAGAIPQNLASLAEEGNFAVSITPETILAVVTARTYRVGSDSCAQHSTG